jgi:hypothetical protein
MTEQYDPTIARAKDLNRRYNKLARWHVNVAAFNANPHQPFPKGLPSKNLKAQAYADAYALIEQLGLTVPEEMMGTLHMLRFVLIATGYKPVALPASIPTHPSRG